MQKKQILKSYGLVLTLLGFSSILSAQDLSVDAMPAGSEVTIPGGAGTIVPLSTRVMVSATDAPQTIILTPTGPGATPIEISIFDRRQDRVKYVKAAPGTPFLYSFDKLTSIYLIPKLPKNSKTSPSSVKLRIASDKAMSVAR